jgi:hypothetical protein
VGRKRFGVDPGGEYTIGDGSLSCVEGDCKPRSLHCATRRAKNGAEEKTGCSGRDDSWVPWW